MPRIRGEAEISNGALELALPLRILLQRQPHGAGVEGGHVGPRADVVRGQERVELGAALADAEARRPSGVSAMNAVRR